VSLKAAANPDPFTKAVNVNGRESVAISAWAQRSRTVSLSTLLEMFKASKHAPLHEMFAFELGLGFGVWFVLGFGMDASGCMICLPNSFGVLSFGCYGELVAMESWL
jgi:hypothetical protein